MCIYICIYVYCIRIYVRVLRQTYPRTNVPCIMHLCTGGRRLKLQNFSLQSYGWKQDSWHVFWCSQGYVPRCLDYRISVVRLDLLGGLSIFTHDHDIQSMIYDLYVYGLIIHVQHLLITSYFSNDVPCPWLSHLSSLLIDRFLPAKSNMNEPKVEPACGDMQALNLAKSEVFVGFKGFWPIRSNGEIVPSMYSTCSNYYITANCIPYNNIVCQAFPSFLRLGIMNTGMLSCSWGCDQGRHVFLFVWVVPSF